MIYLTLFLWFVELYGEVYKLTNSLPTNMLQIGSGLRNKFTFCLADGPAEDLFGIFINRVRRERPPDFFENIRG